MFKDETCLNESFYLFILIQNIYWIVFFFAICTPQANLFGNYVCKCRFNENYHVFTHLMRHCKKERTLFFGGQSMKDNFQ
jgi:hypothetical protein